MGRELKLAAVHQQIYRGQQIIVTYDGRYHATIEGRAAVKNEPSKTDALNACRRIIDQTKEGRVQMKRMTAENLDRKIMKRLKHDTGIYINLNGVRYNVQETKSQSFYVQNEQTREASEEFYISNYDGYAHGGNDAELRQKAEAVIRAKKVTKRLGRDPGADGERAARIEAKLRDGLSKAKQARQLIRDASLSASAVVFVPKLLVAAGDAEDAILKLIAQMEAEMRNL